MQSGFVDGTLQTRQRALRGGRDGHRVAGVEQTFDAGRRFGLVAAVFVRFGRVELDMPLPGALHAEAGEFPHIMPGEDKRGNRLFEIVEVRLVEGDRGAGTMPGSGDMPAGGEEFIGRFGQIIGCATKFFRIGQHDQRAFGKHALHRFHVVHQGGQQRFHTFDGNGVCYGFKHVLGIGNGADE